MTKDNSNTRTPIIRFPGFTGEWREKKMNEVFSRVTRKNAENNQNVLTISAQYGLISQLEFFKKSVASSDVTGYYLLHKGEFAYNKSSSQGRPVGAIKPLRLYDKGVVSTLYICFKCNNPEEIDFWEQYFDAGILDSEILSIAQEGARNHGLLNISTGDFFGLNVILPTPPEMKKIAECLSSFDDVIMAAENELDSLKAHKKGLMQQLFPQPGATTPALRFPGYSGEWEEKTFGELYKKNNIKNDLSFGIDKIISVANMYFKADANIGDKEYLKSYNVFRLGDIAYEGNKSANYAYGRFVENTIGDGIVSHVFDVYSPISKDHCFGYWKYAINYERIMRPVLEKSTIKSTMMTNLIAKDFLKQKTLVPTPAEQQKIAECLEAEDRMISVQEQKVESLKTHKKGLMQQLFPQPEK
mgnify:CR=1 FL=1